MSSDQIDQLRAQAIDGTISEERAHLSLLQASRGANRDLDPTPGTAGGNDVAALEAAICITAGVKEDAVAEHIAASGGDAERVMNTAVSARYRGAGIARLVYAACAQAGHSIPAGAQLDSDAVRAAFQHSIQAASAISTISVPGILSRVANKAMLQSYAEADNGGVILRIASTTSTSDFKKFDRYRMTEAGVMELVPATGRIPHGTVTEEAYENKVDTYGKMFNLSYQMIRNDDMGAFLQIPMLLGRQGRHALEQIGITKLVDATSVAGAGTTQFFHSAARGKKQPNYLAGAGTALSMDSLEAAYTLFLNQVDANGKPIMIDPGILLTCNGDAVLARKLYNDTEYRFTTADTKETINNQWQGMFRPEKSSYLGTMGETPNANQWYLLSDPSTGVAAIQVAFLDGQRTPIIEQGSVDFDQLGVGYRGYFNFGIALQDPRAAVKADGQA